MLDELISFVIECFKNLEGSNENSFIEIVLDIWDFAGQYLYYAIYFLFFCYRVVYFFVYNLKKKLNDFVELLFKRGD